MPFGDCAFSERTYSATRETRAVLFGTARVDSNLEYRIYAATKEFVTASTDTPANQPFYGTLEQPLSIKRSILGSDLIGRFVNATGSLVLTNTEGTYDYLIQQYAIDGRDIVVKVGREGDAYTSFYTIFDGTASDWSVEEDVLSITVEDNGYKLLVPAQTVLYAGTGGVEGGDDLAGRPKPLCYGSVLNVSPPLVIPASLVYQVHDGSVQDIIGVYNKGSQLTQGLDYATPTLLLAAVIPSGQYATCKAYGLFRLNNITDGTVITADVFGDNTGSGFVGDTAGIVRRIIARTTIVDPDDLYLPSFTAVAAVQPASIGVWLGSDSTSTAADVLSSIMEGVGGWCGFRRSGKFEVGIFTLPSGSPHARFDSNDIIEIKRERLPTSNTPPFRMKVGYQKIWTVQTDVAGSVSAARVAFLAEEYRYATTTDLAIKVDHPFAKEHEPIPGLFRFQADAATESARLLTLYRSTRGLYRITLDTYPYILDIGDVVSVTYPRWDLTTGRSLRVVEISENAQDNTIELVCFG